MAVHQRELKSVAFNESDDVEFQNICKIAPSSSPPRAPDLIHQSKTPNDSTSGLAGEIAAAIKEERVHQRDMIKALIREEIAAHDGVGGKSQSTAEIRNLSPTDQTGSPSNLFAAAAKNVSSSRRPTVLRAPSLPIKPEAASYTSLQGGDLITLRVSDLGLKGYVLGSMAERTVAVESEAGFEEHGSGASQVSRRFDDCVFRIISRLNYRAQTELNKINKAVRQSTDPEETKKAMKLEQAQARAQSEAAQNEEALGKLHRGVGFAIKYGDVVQLEHRKSLLFLAMHKTPAPTNSNCRKVSMKNGSFAAHFRILPRFKVRSIGSLVYANDEIVLQSVKFDPILLGGSGMPNNILPSPTLLPVPLGVRLPSVLKHGACFEVNGSMDLRSFTVKMYARFGEQESNSLVTGLHRFRLFHPEANAFIQASGDPDKGEVLDARDPAKQRRTRPLRGASIAGDGDAPPVMADDVPAHIPYLKVVAGDVSNPANFSAKAAWRFEHVDRIKAGTVQWKTPLRIRHGASDKYLSVDSLNQTNIRALPLRPSTASGGGIGGRESVAGDEQQDAENAGTTGKASMYNAALVSDVIEGAEEGAFGSPSSMIFYLMPTDVTSETLKHGVSTMRIEHRTAAGFTLHFKSPREPKPSLTPLDLTDDDAPPPERAAEEVVGGAGTGIASTISSKQKALAQEKKGERLLFSSRSSSVDVLKLLPLTQVEGWRIDTLCSRVRLFRLYAHCYQNYNAVGRQSWIWKPGEGSSNNGNSSNISDSGAISGGVNINKGRRPPTDLCEAVTQQCLALIDDFRKGEPPPARHANAADAMKEANATLPAMFAGFFTGEPDTRMQRVAMEVKVLDAVFEAALAPYNRALNAARPFECPPANDQPQALVKFLYVTLQRGLWNNPMAQEYFAGRSSRAWFTQNNIPHLTPPASPPGAASIRVAGRTGLEVSIKSGASTVVAPPLSRAVRRWTLWRDLVISQSEDSLGATVTLGQLLGASEAIVAKLVSNELMARFKGLIKRCGPEPRLINLFAAICTVAGKPSRANQEMCVRQIWMNLPDRYSLGLTFHECDDATVPEFGWVATPSGEVCGPPPTMRAPAKAPAAFLGKTDDNEYGPICVAWTGADEWKADCGKLFWSAKSLSLPVVETLDTGEPQEPPKGGVGELDLVPVECLMWVLEPERLCESVTGVKWAPLGDTNVSSSMRSKTGSGSSRPKVRSSLRGNAIAAANQSAQSSPDSEVVAATETHQSLFTRQLQLAGYVVAQFVLLTQMCKGRSANAISWLEKSFSYECLMNLASNPRCPFVFRSAVLDFLQALYVNRFPQLVNSGAPCLPEHLWIYHEPFYPGERKSTTPILQPLTLSSEAAFPYFFVPPLSSVARDPNPMLSFPTHFKFFLLRSLTNQLVTSFGESGRMVHSLGALNDLVAAAVRGQQGLLDFGFQSTYVKLKDLCEANAKLLDGRSDLEKPGQVFEPPEKRFRENGPSAVITKMKCEVIGLFIDVGNLRANYRLAKFLQLFKTHAQKGEVGFLLGRTDADIKTLYEDFESMFPGGSDDAAKLDIAVLGNKPDVDQALVDCLMYDDDSLMEAALSLLDKTYGQRRMLRQALEKATLLSDARIPVYGHVHALRNCLNDLLFQARTITSWGVKSRISGPFGDSEFGSFMSNVEKLLVFLHTANDTANDAICEDEGRQGGFSMVGRSRSLNFKLLSPKKSDTISDDVCPLEEETEKKDLLNYQGYFKETDLQGNTYECKELWSLDVAAKWRKRKAVSGDVDLGKKCNEHHQSILRACNLQSTLAEGMVMDHEIAWKGSICTEREKVESERRLTLAKKALLSLSLSFVDGNKENQEVLFGHMGTLQALATPPELQDSVASAKGFDERLSLSTPESSPVFSAGGGFDASSEEDRTWPSTVPDFAQNLITHILWKNEDLCDRIKRPLIELFASLVDCSEDCSSAPTLDLLFVLAQPQHLPIQENQSAVAEMMLDSAAFPRLAKAVCDVLSPDGSGTMENPARLVSLVCTVMLNKNEHAASQLMQFANVTIDATCAALVSLVELAVLKSTMWEADSGGETRSVLDRSESRTPTESSFEMAERLVAAKAARRVLTGEFGSKLLSLLAEQVILCPMNAVQLTSAALWQFLGGPAALTLEAFATVERMGKDELVCCEDLFDVLEHTFTVLQRLGMMDNVFSDTSKATVVANMTEDLQVIFDNREMTDDTLRHAFVDALLRSGQKVGLDRERFKRLVVDLDHTKHKNLSLPQLSSSNDDNQTVQNHIRGIFSNPVKVVPHSSAPSENSFALSPKRMFAHSASKVLKVAAKTRAEREAEVEEAFDIADVDGNGQVDLYEFVGLYAKLSGKTTPSRESKGTGERKAECSTEDEPLPEGHALSMRTVEAGERILAIAKAPKFAQLLKPSHFSRADKFPPRENKGGKKQKLFKPSPVVVNPAPPGSGDDHRRKSTTTSILGGGSEKSDEPEMRTLAQCLHAFKKTVMGNPRILGALQRRRFTMVTVLEHGTPAPLPQVGRALKYSSFQGSSEAAKDEVENRLCSAVEIGWSDVVKRFVAYCTEHFWSSDVQDDGGGDNDGVGGGRTVQLIFETWMAHLVKARTLALEEDGVTPADSIPKAAMLRQVTPRELSNELYAEYHAKQLALNTLGVTELLANVISSLDDFSAGGLPDMALELFIELMNGGCSEVADSLFNFLLKFDSEGKFLKHLDHRLETGLDDIRNAKKRGGLGGVDGGMSDEMEATCDSIITTTRFMQLLCEGHNLKFQCLLRAQPMHSGQQFNLVKKVVEIFVLFCESSVAVSFFQGIELDVVSQLLDLLIELMQGPCAGNQEEIVESDALVAINNIIPAHNAFDLVLCASNPLRMDIRGQACVLLAACLEGREDFDCHNPMTRKLEVSALFGYQDIIEAEIRKTRASALGRLLNPLENQKVLTLQAALVAVVTVEIELRQEKRENQKEQAASNALKESGDGLDNTGDGPGGGVVEDGETEEKSSKEEERLHAQALVGIIEVAWRKQIERNVFAMPFEVNYLTMATKKKFLEEVDLSTSEKRMSELMQSSDHFIAEMTLIHDKAEQSPMFRALHNQMPTFKNYLYGLVMLLNLNVIMSTNKTESPARAVLGYLEGELDLSGLEVVSLALTVLLFLLVITGYFVIIGHLASTEIPMVMLELDAAWENTDTEVDELTNPRAWGTFIAALFLAIIFVFMHFINYTPVPGWYLTLALLLIPIFLLSYRAAIVRPTSKFQRYFCVCYDAVVHRSFLRNHALLALCSVLGMYDVEFFTLELLDVVNISPIIGDIIKSVTEPGTALFYTLYLFIATSVIYASFGMAFFQDQLQIPLELSDSVATARRLDFEEEEEGDWHFEEEEVGGRHLRSKAQATSSTDSGAETETCRNLFHCTLFVFYQGMSESGNMKSFLSTASPGTYNYIPRIIYDSVYFVWVGIVLVNIITGLMVDTFSAIRGDKAERAETLESDCFVCGMQRGSYEELGLKPGSPVFSQHLSRDHHLWTYVYFVAYLKRKDPTEYNGIESYVRKEIDKGSLEWLPSRTSFVLQDQGKGGGHSADVAAAAQAERSEAAAAASGEKMNSILAQLAILQQTDKGPQGSSAMSEEKLDSVLAYLSSLKQPEKAISEAAADKKMDNILSQLSALQQAVAALTAGQKGGSEDGLTV